MRSANLLSSSNVEKDHLSGISSISFDLTEAIDYLTLFVDAIHIEGDHEGSSDLTEITRCLEFSRTSILRTVASLVEAKFIQVALDVHDSVSVMHIAGVRIFKDDIDRILSVFPRDKLIPFNCFVRIDNIMKLLVMDSPKYTNLRSAALQLLSEIDQFDPPLDDTPIIEVIQSMLFAQEIDVSVKDALRIFTKRLQ